MKIMNWDHINTNSRSVRTTKLTMFTEHNSMLVQLELNKGQIKTSFLNVLDVMM